MSDAGEHQNDLDQQDGAGVGYGYLRAAKEMEPRVKALGADVDRMAAYVDTVASICGQQKIP